APGVPGPPPPGRFGRFGPALFAARVGDVLVPKVGPEVWAPPADDRSVADLVLVCQLLAAHEVDATGGYVPLNAARLQEVWNSVAGDRAARGKEAAPGLGLGRPDRGLLPGAVLKGPSAAVSSAAC